MLPQLGYGSFLTGKWNQRVWTLIICEVEAFKHFNKVMGARPEKTKKIKAESKKKKQKNEGITTQ